MKASLITKLKATLSDPDHYKLIDPTDKELTNLIYSLGDVGLKKLYLINVVANFLHDRLYVRVYKEWDQILKVLELNPNLQRELASVCESDVEKDALIKLTFPTRFQDHGALDNNHILLFYFFRDHQDLFPNIFRTPDLASNGLVRSLAFIVDALDLGDDADIAEYKTTLRRFIVFAKSENKESFHKATSEEAIARYRTGCTLETVLADEFTVASSNYTQKLVAAARSYSTSIKAVATTLDEWWESLHPYDFKVYKRLKAMDTEANKLSDKYLKEKVLPFLKAMKVFDAEVVRYYKEHYEAIFIEIAWEILQGNTARIYILRDLGINLDFAELKITEQNDQLNFVKIFFSIEAILFYMKGIKFEDLLSLVTRDGVLVFDDETLQNFAGFINLQIYTLITYSNSYEILFTLYNNTAFKSIIFDENVINILLHSAEKHDNKVDLNALLLTRGLVYNHDSKNFHSVKNNFTGYGGDKLRKQLFGENTIALMDATGYSIEQLIQLGLEKPKDLESLYLKLLSNELKEQASSSSAAVDDAQPEAQPQEAVDDDNGHSLANSVIYGGKLITHNPLEAEHQVDAVAVAAQLAQTPRAPSPTPPAAQSTMIAGAAYSGTALQTSASSSTSTATVVQQKPKQQKKGGKGHS